MKFDCFNLILAKAREQDNTYEDAGLWLAVAKIGRGIADRYMSIASRAEREDAASLTCVKLIRLYKKQRKLGVDIFTDYSAERLYRTVCKMAYCTAVDCYKAAYARLRREVSLAQPVGTDGDDLTLADTIPDSKTLAPDETAVARSVIRKAIKCADLSTLVYALGIKRGEFCQKGERYVSPERFTHVLATHLMQVTDRKTLCEYCDRLLALGQIDIVRLYNKIYNETRKRALADENELILTLLPDTDGE